MQKKETDLGVHVMQVRCVLWVWCGLVWHGRVGMGWQLRWSILSMGYTVP